MSVEVGSTFTATLVDPGGVSAGVGARVEVPVTRAIASYWRPATLVGDLWTVVLEAPASPGEFNLVWMSGDDPVSVGPIFVPLEVTAPGTGVGDLPADFPAVDVSEVTPSTADVGALVRTRTVDEGGTEIGDFTDTTRPSADEVQVGLADAVDEVLAQLPEQFDPRHYGRVSRAVALQMAITIETSYYREQSSDAAVTALQSRLTTLIGGLQARIAEDFEQRYEIEAGAGAILA